MPDALLIVIRAVLFPYLLLSNSAMLVAAAIITTAIRTILPSLYSRGMRHLKVAFVHLLLALHYIFVPSKVVVTSNLGSIDRLADLNGQCWTGQGIIKSRRRDLCISNHQTYVDWIYLWFFFWKIGREDELIITLKDSLRKIPIFGWVASLNYQGMRLLKFIFLKRKWCYDKPYLESRLLELKKSPNPFILLIFPEGTTYSENGRKRTVEFAGAEGLSIPKFTLIPRSSGLNLMLGALRPTLTGIFDLTVAYSGMPEGEIPELHFSLKRLYFLGLHPPTVHIHLNYFNLDLIPSDDAEFSNWLRDRFYRKDEQLQFFHVHGHFDGKVISTFSFKSNLFPLFVLFWTAMSYLLYLLLKIYFQ